jgi:hypothetical protein
VAVRLRSSRVGAKNPAVYLPTIHPDRLAEQRVPDADSWDLDDFEAFLAQRREAQAATLNDLWGLPPYVPGRPRGAEGDLPADDDEVTADEEG